MLSFCTSPHGLVNEPPITGPTRRQRRASLPSITPGFATVKRVASLGGKRSLSGRSRRGNLKALISQPRDFVHLSHVDGSSTSVSAREIIGIDISLLQRAVAECHDSQQALATPTVPPIEPIQEHETEAAPVPDEDKCAPVTTPTESPSESSPITTVTANIPVSAADVDLSSKKSRRTSMIKRKPVPAYDEDDSTISTTAEIRPSPIATSPILEASASEEPAV